MSSDQPPPQGPPTGETPPPGPSGHTGGWGGPPPGESGPGWQAGPPPHGQQAGPPPYGQQAGPPPYGYPHGSQLSPQEERTWAMLAHLSGLIAAFLFLGFLGPLIVMLVQGHKSPFVRRHAVEALNFQISLLLLTIAATVLTVITFGFAAIIVLPLGLLVAVAALIMIIIGAAKGNNGEEYRYPLNLRLVS